MRQRAHPAVIGGFVVGAVALIVITVLLLGRGRFWTEQRTYVLYFDDSVEGLSVGAPVNFQGVRVGAVTGVQVQYLTREGEFRVPVFIDIEPDQGQGGRQRRPAQRGGGLPHVPDRARPESPVAAPESGDRPAVRATRLPPRHPRAAGRRRRGRARDPDDASRPWPKRPPRPRASWSGSSDCPSTRSSPTCWGPCRASTDW